MRLVAGFLLWVMAMGIAISCGLLLTGCAGVSQAVQAYGTVAVTGAHSAADTLVQAQKATICDLPYSAVQRDSQMVAIVPILCGPLK